MTKPQARMTLVDHHGRKYLTGDERQRFFAAVRTHRRPTVQTLASTLALTGCRISEALGLRACDVDLTAAELRIRTLKRRKETWRAVPVPKDHIRELDLVHLVRGAQASPRGRTALLWDVTRQAAHRQVAALMRAARIEGPQACPRGLRHSFGVVAVQAGVLTTIAAVLGHADVSTTAIYATGGHRKVCS